VILIIVVVVVIHRDGWWLNRPTSSMLDLFSQSDRFASFANSC